MMQQEQNQFNFQPDTEEEINFKRFFYLVFNRWHWIAISAFVCLVIAFFYSKSLQQNYEINATILVPEKDNTFDLKNIFEDNFGGGMSVVENEVELLRSYTLNSRTIEKLNWQTSWYQKQFLKSEGMYGHEPFAVEVDTAFQNIEDCLIDIEMVSPTEFNVSVDGEIERDGQPIDVDFEGMGKINDFFQNQYVKFRLIPANGIVLEKGMSFQFVFHSNNVLTKAYQKKIKAELTDKKSEVIRITVEGEEPLRDVHFVNQLIDNYLDWKLLMETQIQQRSLDFVQKQLDNFADSLKTASNAFTTFRSENQIVDLSTQGKLVMEQMNALEQQILTAQAQLDYFNNLLTYLKQNSDGGKLVSPSVVGIQDVALNSLVMRLSELYNRRETLQMTAKDNNPSLTLIDNELNEVKRQLGENLHNLIQNTQMNLKSLQKYNKEIAGKLNQLPGQEQRLININRRYELMGELYDLMLQKRAEFEISLASAVVNIHVIDPARIQNAEPIGKSTKVILIIGLLIGLVLPIGLILLIDQMDSRIHVQEDVEKLTTLNVLGHVLRNTGNSELMVVEDPASPMSESLRSIRTSIKYVLSETHQKVIGIHSMNPGEGKTFVAVNLASIMAMNGHKTLLIGTDMRKPRLAEILHQHHDSGLSTYLANLATLEEVLKSTSVENLWAIAAGPKPPNPAELLERERFNELIAFAKKEFDYIVIDNSPVSLVTDGFVTGKFSDMNVMVVRNGVSRKSQMKFVNDIATKGLLKNTKVVINDVNPTSYGYYNSYGYKYSYSNKY